MMAQVVSMAAFAAAASGLAAAFLKTWQWVRHLQEGQKCLLRSQMLHTYYKHKDSQTIRQYEFENFTACYQAYRAMGGNSFIAKIYDEISGWEVIS